MANIPSGVESLRDNATVAIIGGGPAGSFFAIHLLRQARARRRRLRIVVFERRRPPPRAHPDVQCGPYKGCPRCAAGISPRLYDALTELGIVIPENVLQNRIQSISVQGDWKPVYLDVPKDRRMLSVFRGTLPHGNGLGHASFDEFLIDAATDQGAELIGSPVQRVFYDLEQHPVLCYNAAGRERTLTADFVAFACGVNERAHPAAGRLTASDLFRMLQPAYVPPRLRKALIVELAAPRDCIELTGGRLHYVESSADDLRLEMCSLLPKDGFVTITLIGGSVDDAMSNRDNLAVIRRFVATSRARRILPADSELRIRCVCNPSIVVGTATMPFAHRAAAIGDMAATRLYKDGILAAHDMARDLAEVIFERGIDSAALATGYGSTVDQFRRDNRYARLIFSLYRWFFTSRSWSRIIYQTFASERKSQYGSSRSFEQIFWAVSSGDEDYQQIAWAMIRPATMWKILIGGVFVTIRNRLTELTFGLDWAEIGRLPTAVPIERLRDLREKLIEGRSHEFECGYTIHVRAGQDEARRLLAELGEPARPYLNPRWVQIRRVSGEPLQTGCVIRYQIFGGVLSFKIVQQESGDENLIRYKVIDSFPDGGSFTFLIEPVSESHCAVTVHLAFDYKRGTSPTERIVWWAFRSLFPKYIHDVLWNHALCEFNQVAEDRSTEHPRCATAV
jgi:flavin-dependent dehydrogenase